MKKLLVFAYCFIALAVPAAADDRIGVVLMHGKLGSSGPRSPIAPLIRELTNNGISVIAPDMPWSKKRQFDKTIKEAMEEIDILDI